MSNAPDMTKAQFRAACKRHGFYDCKIMGYFTLPDTPTHVSVWNVGKRLRDQLAYLIQEHRRLTEDREAPA